MMAYLRIKKIEDELIKKVSDELNRQRLEINKPVMKESEIFHEVIIKGLENCKIENGEIVFRS